MSHTDLTFTLTIPPAAQTKIRQANQIETVGQMSGDPAVRTAMRKAAERLARSAIVLMDRAIWNFAGGNYRSKHCWPSWKGPVTDVFSRIDDRLSLKRG